MAKYKRIEQRIVDLKKLHERNERMKYKLKLYGLNLLTRAEIDDLKSKREEMTDLEKSLGNMLFDLNETAVHCVGLIDWYENDREAILTELGKLRELNRELLKN